MDSLFLQEVRLVMRHVMDLADNGHLEIDMAEHMLEHIERIARLHCEKLARIVAGGPQ